jgi:ubiquinone/menaquinone biosynthesis C-methylase UbiE
MSDSENDHWNIDDWIKKLKQQAEESREYRHALYEKVDLKNKKEILDVGCGTGAVTLDLAQSTNGNVVGIDIDPEKFKEAEKALSNIANIKLMKADVLDLPFPDETFDLVVFTVVLIYIKDQQKALNEMARVTKTGGIVMATLEPDYASYISYPEDPIAPLVKKNMELLGADTRTGRKLKFLFANAGLKTEVGIETAGDYLIMKDDAKLLEMFHEQLWVIKKIFKRFDWKDEDIEQYRTEMEKRKTMGTQFAFMPSFYAIGKKVSNREQILNTNYCMDELNG